MILYLFHKIPMSYATSTRARTGQSQVSLIHPLLLDGNHTTSGLQQQGLWKYVKNEKKALLLKFYKDFMSIREHIQSRLVDEDEREENEEEANIRGLYRKVYFENPNF